MSALDTGSDKPSDDLVHTWQTGATCLALDGVRGLAILAVTLYRICKELGPSDHPLLNNLYRFAPVGERGVELFFVLSGFLISGILLRTKGNDHYFRNFWVRRAIRIFPLYFTCLVICLWILPWLVGESGYRSAREEQFYLWTYTSNLRMSWLNQWCFGPLDHFWSLAVEEHFYLVWPILVWIFPTKRLGIICLGMIVGVGVARTLAALNPRFDVAVSVATHFHADAIVFGCLLAIGFELRRISPNPEGWKKRIERASWLMLVILIPLLIGLALSRRRLLEVGSTLCPAAFFAGMAILILSKREALLVRLLEWRPLRILGRYSYGMYVVQLPLVTAFPATLLLSRLPLNPVIASGLYSLCMFVGIVSLAAISYHLLESPFLRLRKYFS
jgi:peptidoglycan/LPS O-acetylase OafA/YrhL